MGHAAFRCKVLRDLHVGSSMRASLPAVLLLVAGAAACAASPPPSPVTSSSPPVDSCKAIAQQAAQRVGVVLGAQRSCASDADCLVVPQGASCFDHCTTVIARAGQPALQSVVADVDAHECRDFATQGCRVEVPPCSPPGAAACHKGVCG